MKKARLAMLAAAALMCASCFEPPSHSTEQVADTTTSDKKLAARSSNTAIYRPEAYESYNVKFWDSLDTQLYPDKKHERKMMTASVHDISDMKLGNSGKLAFQLGEFFACPDVDKIEKRLDIVKLILPQVASKDSSTSAGEKYFVKCMQAADKDNQSGKAALMMSGYYFGYLLRVAENTNENTKSPDETALRKGISRLDSLKSYCNNVLQDEKEIKLSLPLQRITVQSEEIKKIYADCQNSQSEDKYSKLIDKLKSLDTELFD